MSHSGGSGQNDRSRAQRIASAERAIVDAEAAIEAHRPAELSLNVTSAMLQDYMTAARACLAVAQDCLTMVKEAYKPRLPGGEPAASTALIRDQFPQGQGRRVDDYQIADQPGLDLAPDPSKVTSADEFLDVLRRYRLWSGAPSYRMMERLCGRQFAASTIFAALHGNQLPRLDMIVAIIEGCGGYEEHKTSFVSAWRRLKLSSVQRT